MCITGDQFGELGQHHVLRTGRPLLLGLDLLRSFNCGECLCALCPLIPDISDTDTDAWENMVMSVKAAQKKACNIHDKLDQAIRTLHIKGIIQQLKQKSIHKKSFQQQNEIFLKIFVSFFFSWCSRRCSQIIRETWNMKIHFDWSYCSCCHT